MRKMSEGLSKVSKKFITRWNSYKSEVETELKLTFNKTYVDILLPYDFKYVYDTYLKTIEKYTGLSVMISNFDFTILHHNILRIKLNKISPLIGEYTFTSFTDTNTRLWYETLDRNGVMPSGDGEYSLEIICNELLSNYYIHDVRLDTKYLKHLGIYVDSFDEFISFLGEGFQAYFTDNKLLEDQIKRFIFEKDYISDIHLNNKDLKLSRYDQFSWDITKNELQLRKDKFKKEVVNV